MKDQFATKNDTNACCDNANNSCCGSDNQKREENNQVTQTSESAIIKATIDGLEVIIEAEDINIVELAKNNGIGIPAPCYLDKKRKGCCNACVVEINGVQKYACSQKPENGMNIIVNREDLLKLRKERLEDYKNAIKNNQFNSCSCNSSDCC